MSDLGLRSLVDAIVGPRRLLDHPFYVRWSRGELARDELRTYAAQYRHFEASLPGFLTRVAETADDPALRRAAMRNHADEAGGPSTHLELFDAFLRGLDGEVHADVSPAMAELLGTYERCAATSPRTGLAAILAYEVQAAEVARSKAAGLREHYGVDDAAVEFWDLHAGLEGDHASWLMDALTAASDETASLEAATRDACDAWLAFLNEREAAAA